MKGLKVINNLPAKSILKFKNYKFILKLKNTINKSKIIEIYQQCNNQISEYYTKMGLIKIKSNNKSKEF